MKNKTNKEIIEEFREKFPYLYDGCDGRTGYDGEVTEDVKNFILQALEQKEREIVDRITKIHQKSLYELLLRQTNKQPKE